VTRGLPVHPAPEVHRGNQGRLGPRAVQALPARLVPMIRMEKHDQNHDQTRKWHLPISSESAIYQGWS
jgi:hypothetical protein